MGFLCKLVCVIGVLQRSFQMPVYRRAIAFFVVFGGRTMGLPLRANIDETVLPVVITEQGENRNRCEEQRNLFGFSYGLACRGT